MATSQTIIVCFAVYSGVKASATPFLSSGIATSSASSVASLTSSPAVSYTPTQLLIGSATGEIFTGNAPFTATWSNGGANTRLSSINNQGGVIAACLDQGSTATGSSTTLSEAFTSGTDRLRVMTAVFDHS